MLQRALFSFCSVALWQSFLFYHISIRLFRKSAVLTSLKLNHLLKPLLTLLFALAAIFIAFDYAACRPRFLAMLR